MKEGNLTTNFWKEYYPTANFFSLLLYYVFLHRRNISANKLIRQRSHLNDQLTLLTEYALYLGVGYTIIADLPNPWWRPTCFLQITWEP